MRSHVNSFVEQLAALVLRCHTRCNEPRIHNPLHFSSCKRTRTPHTSPDTQLIRCQILFGTGDCMAQQLVEKRGLDKHDPARTLRMCGYGGIIFGPAATKWYGFLTKHVNLTSKNGTIAARVACDQFLFAPVNMGAFVSFLASI